MAKEFYYDIIENYGVIDESDNNDWGIAICKVSWNGKPPVIDIRNYNLATLVEGENIRMGKGISFNKDEAVDNLVHKLIELGYGNTEMMEEYIDERKSIFNTNKKVKLKKL